MKYIVSMIIFIMLIVTIFISGCDEKTYLHSTEKKYFFNEEVVVVVTVKLDECQVEFLFIFETNENFTVNVKNELTNKTLKKNETIDKLEINSPYNFDFDFKYSGKWLISIEKNGTVERQEYHFD